MSGRWILLQDAVTCTEVDILAHCVINNFSHCAVSVISTPLWLCFCQPGGAHQEALSLKLPVLSNSSQSSCCSQPPWIPARDLQAACCSQHPLVLLMVMGNRAAGSNSNRTRCEYRSSKEWISVCCLQHNGWAEGRLKAHCCFSSRFRNLVIKTLFLLQMESEDGPYQTNWESRESCCFPLIGASWTCLSSGCQDL